MKDGLCGIYATRPNRCNVEKMRGDIPKEAYYETVKFACQLLRTKEHVDRLVDKLFDKKYEAERKNYRR